MITLNIASVKQLMDERGWTQVRLAADTRLNPKTIERALAGDGVSSKTISALVRVFPKLSFEDLFIVTPGESLSAPAGEPPPVRQSGAVGVSVPHEREAKEEVA